MLDVKAFRAERGITCSQIVNVMREQYPKYDKHLHSKVERPAEYGIRLVNDAERLLTESFTKTLPDARKRDRHRLPCRIQFRLTKAKFERLQQHFRAAGYKTMQEGMSDMITRYLAGIQGEADD